MVCISSVFVPVILTLSFIFLTDSIHRNSAIFVDDAAIHSAGDSRSNSRDQEDLDGISVVEGIYMCVCEVCNVKFR